MNTMQLFVELAIAFCATLAITTSVMPFFIIYFTNKKIGHVTREEGPNWHNVKSGTPTMGGIAFLIATSITSLVFSVYKGWINLTTSALIVVFIAFGIIGFLDDFLKLVRRQNEGLTSKQKFIAQLVFSLFAICLLVFSGHDTSLSILFFGKVNNVVLYGVFAIVWMTGFSNAVNLTDGLDGLVAGTASIALAGYAVIAYRQAQFDILFFCVALIGGLCGFFIFNKKPAKIFMGDVGSLALGGVFAMISMLLHVEWSLLLIGLVFVIETASVILQVGSYKLRKKRIFKMSPLHHHFEMSGWSEWKVVLVFWLVSACATILYLCVF
ncbi:phospho-N-acetylmuramoyl-pentapeptide-transferase [Carnobacteriaceae bacterium zg-ZUI252]|nr:phospho-N-acetylmuramoyl-pentapeptide-transferase [Carnobacteriaceae bacterium zg-ZUI252]QTU82698.1 phospho-N-acetylmuramoyl-pentapeptide-transferase [Carnobacteriaceae bacterium zg-C25]